MPFPVQTISDDPALDRSLTLRWTAHEFLPASPLRPARRSEPGKLRIGFLSPDFHSHPVGRLVVGLIERLDRNRFEVCAFSTEKEVDDAIQSRIRRACDRFRSFPVVDAREVAEAIRADRIDVLIDLTGHTAGANLSTLSLRPAPVQVNYLGYTGTLGSPAVDWIVADPYCIPPDLADAYVERPLYLEPCYMPRCGDHADDDVSISRSDYGLPEHALVYAAMSAAYKILPERFDAWMEILRAVPGSILWMRTMAGVAARRLRLRAASLGVDPVRLQIARNEPVPRYLARYRLADLYLDTWPFGSHTTVNDALSAGLPVLAQAGRTFASRASASQVIAAGLPELVANGLQATWTSRSRWARIARAWASCPRDFERTARGCPTSTSTPTRAPSRPSSNAPGPRRRSTDGSRARSVTVERCRECRDGFDVVEQRLRSVAHAGRELGTPQRILGKSNRVRDERVLVGRNQVRSADQLQHPRALPAAHEASRACRDRQAAGDGIEARVPSRPAHAVEHRVAREVDAKVVVVVDLGQDDDAACVHSSGVELAVEPRAPGRGELRMPSGERDDSTPPGGGEHAREARDRRPGAA